MTQVMACGCEVANRARLCPAHAALADGVEDRLAYGNRLVQALEGMVWQYGLRVISDDGRPALGTGGMSALEQAFDALGWADPHEVSGSNLCEIVDCAEWRTSGMDWDGLYLGLCSDHAIQALKGGSRPLVRAWAAYRESLRDADGVLSIDPDEAYRRWLAQPWSRAVVEWPRASTAEPDVQEATP